MVKSNSSSLKFKFLPTALFLFFFLSGVSGLIYQVVWMRMLIRVFGISLYAISTVVAVFMIGLAIGSWAASRALLIKKASLTLYAQLETGIAVSAVAASLAMKYLPDFYAAIGSQWYGGGSEPSTVILSALRFLLATGGLAIPTIFMGATLPVLIQYCANINRKVGADLALLYGANTLGAVGGVIFTGFISLAIWGESASIGIGVVINLIVATMAFISERYSILPSSMEKSPLTISGKIHPRRFFLIIGALTGFCALSFEVLWSRYSIFLVGSSVYAFSSILSMYLLGIGVGSLMAMRFIDNLKRPNLTVGGLQIIIAVTAMLSLYIFWHLGRISSGPEFLYSPLRSAADLFRFFFVSALVVFPGTFFMGVSFPLLGRLVTKDYHGFAGSVGLLYAWNTLGGVAGSLITGYFLVPVIGTQATLCLIAFSSLLIGSAVIIRERTGNIKPWLVLSAVYLAFVVAIPSKTNITIDILKRRFSRIANSMDIMFHREEAAGTLTGIKIPRGSMLLINGIIVSGNGIPGHVMAHLPLLLHPNPQRAAVICFGVGNTFRAAIDHIGRVDAVELMPGVVTSFGDFFEKSDRYLNYPKARVFIEDGRQHLLMTRDQYDVIIVDASPPIFSAGTVNLYTKDFLKICQKRLSPDGIMCLWVPTPCFERDFWRIAKGYSSVYPNMLVWAKKGMGGVLIMGSSSDLETAFQNIKNRLNTRNLGESSDWFTLGFINDSVIFSGEEIRRRASSYEIVTDDKPYTEFPLSNFLSGHKFWTSNDFLIFPTASPPSKKSLNPTS